MRLTTAFVALLLAPLLTPAAMAATPDGGAASTARPRITIGASPEWVRKGDVVTLRGSVEGVRGRASVTIYQKNKGSRRWVVEAVKRTSRKGSFTHREDIKTGDRTYRACVGRVCDSVVVHMGKQPQVATSVAISSLSSGSIEAGQSFTTTGTASGNLEGRQVEVQAYDAGTESWGAVGAATVRGGAWSAPASLSTAGKSIPLRASFAGGVGLKPSTSTAASIVVYGWYYLSEMEPVDGSPLEGPMALNGVTYARSIGMEDWLEEPQYNLSRSCKRLVSTVGVSDYSSTETEYAVVVTTDSVAPYSRSGMRIGQSFPVDLSVEGVLRLQFEVVLTSGDEDDTLVFGDARVLCAF